MLPRLLFPSLVWSATLLTGWSATPAGPKLGIGESVRLTRGETPVYDGKNLSGGAKGQEFVLLQLDPAKQLALVEYYKKDGSRIAAALPADALEPSPADGWSDLLHGVESFRDGRYEASRALLLRAAQDAKYKALATAISQRFSLATMGIARAPTAQAMQALRELAMALCKNGSYSLGYAVDLGADRLATQSPAAALPSKLEAEDKKRGEAAIRASALCRQTYSAHKTREAAGFAKEALAAEPTRTDIAELQKKITKDLSEADGKLEDAERMRSIPKGEVHALTALQMGLKLAADHPGLLKLKESMQEALMSRTSPPVTPALLSAAKSSAPAATLEEGRQLYTTRCTECHDLDMLDSRSSSSWEKMVGGMSGRAHLNGEQQSRIMAYINVALNGMQ